MWPQRLCGLGWRLYSINWLVRTLSTAHRTSLWTSMATACYVWYEVLTSFPWSRTVSVPSPRSLWRPASCRAIVLGSLPAILVQSVEKLRYLSGNFLDGSLLDQTLDQCLHGSKPCQRTLLLVPLGFQGSKPFFNAVRYCF